MSPNEVTEKNVSQFRKKLYAETNILPNRTTHTNISLGDTVRILCYAKSAFTKNAEQKWTEEYFEVYARLDGNPIVFLLKDMLDVPIRGRFTEHQLQLAETNAAESRQIDKVVKVQQPPKRLAGRHGRLYTVKYIPPSRRHLLWQEHHG